MAGNSQITRQQRDWVIGYLTVAGDSPEVLEAVRIYDDSHLIEDIMSVPKMAFTRRGVLYDALRICYVAGTPDPASWTTSSDPRTQSASLVTRLPRWNRSWPGNGPCSAEDTS